MHDKHLLLSSLHTALRKDDILCMDCGLMKAAIIKYINDGYSVVKNTHEKIYILALEGNTGCIINEFQATL